MCADIQIDGNRTPPHLGTSRNETPDVSGPGVRRTDDVEHCQANGSLPKVVREIERDVDAYIQELKVRTRSHTEAPTSETVSESDYSPPTGRLARLIERYSDLRFALPEERVRFTDQHRFTRQCAPYRLPHLSSDFPPLVLFSGIASTAYDWKELFTRLHLATGIGGTAYSLDGHTGSFSDLQELTSESMIDRAEQALLEERELIGIPPLAVGHSTGALAVLLASSRHLATHGEAITSGHLLSAPPLRLRNIVHRLGLSLLDRQERLNPDLQIWDHLCMKTRYETLVKRNRREIRSPSVTHLPARALIQMWRMIPESRQALRETELPTVVVQGTKDEFVDWKATRAFMRKSKNPHLAFRPLNDAEHTCMRGVFSDAFLEATQGWLEQNKESLRQNGRVGLLADMAARMADRIELLTRLAGESGIHMDELTLGDLKAPSREILH